VWKKTFFSRHSLPISASGCTTPISLFTAITDTCGRERKGQRGSRGAGRQAAGSQGTGRRRALLGNPAAGLLAGHGAFCPPSTPTCSAALLPPPAAGRAAAGRAHQAGLWADGVCQLLQVDQAALLHRQVRDVEAALLQVPARVQHALVVRLRGRRGGGAGKIEGGATGAGKSLGVAG
jgi:hypothetical protein